MILLDGHGTYRFHGRRDHDHTIYAMEYKFMIFRPLRRRNFASRVLRGFHYSIAACSSRRSSSHW